MLKWSVQALQKHREHPLAFEETVDLEKQLHERENDVLSATPFVISGQLTVDRRAIIADLHVVGELTVPSTRSLNPVVLPLDFTFTEIGRAHV